LIPRILSGELPVEALTPAIRGGLSGVVNFDALRPSPDRLVAPLIEGIESAKTLPELPTTEGALARLRARGVPPTR